MLVASNDMACTKESAERIFNELSAAQKTVRYITSSDGLDPDHEYFVFAAGNRFVDSLIDSIENDIDVDIPAMGILEVASNIIAFKINFHLTVLFVILIIYCNCCVCMPLWMLVAATNSKSTVHHDDESNHSDAKKRLSTIIEESIESESPGSAYRSGSLRKERLRFQIREMCASGSESNLSPEKAEHFPAGP